MGFGSKLGLPPRRSKACRRQSRPWACTVEDTNIEAEGAGYEADDVICKDDGQYDVYLDKDFKVANKVKEN